VQSIVDLPNELGAMKVTVGMFFVAGGQSTQHGGVKSDIQFPSVFGNDEIGEKSLDYSLPPQKIAPFLSSSANSDRPSDRWMPLDDQVVKILAQKSQDRVAASPKFAEITKSQADAKKNEAVKIADLEKKPEKKKDEEANGNARDEMKNLVKPMVDESVSITADLAATLAKGG
jgi:carboxyl-terminal processing protease